MFWSNAIEHLCNTLAMPDPEGSSCSIDAKGNLPALQLQLDQATHHVGSGSLLVRDDDGNFGFIHQSVLEWLVANRAAEELRSGGRSEALTARQISPLMADFLRDLTGREQTVTWAQQTLSAVDASEYTKKNAL